MADCKRGDIPDELYAAKDVGCKNDFLPIPDDNGLVRTITGLRSDGTGNPDPSNCGITELWEVMPDEFEMSSNSWSDDFMSWKSPVFTVPDSPVGESVMIRPQYFNQVCDGLYIANSNIPFPQGCYPPPGLVEGNLRVGQSTNYGYYGSTIQFFFNIYKVYCCVYTGDIVTDFNFTYYWTITYKSSATGFVVADYGGPMDFCTLFSRGRNNSVFNIGIQM